MSEPKYLLVSSLTYTQEAGFSATLHNPKELDVLRSYENHGYRITSEGKATKVECSSEMFSSFSPLFVHKYIHKTFGAIPTLHMAEPQPDGSRYSQLAITHFLSYFLGMLVRYYPTHWISLMNGGKGDLAWPVINRAQQYVESAFPELVIEFIQNKLNNAGRIERST